MTEYEKKEKINLLLAELIEKTKLTKQTIILPTECKILLSEIKNYDFYIFNELEQTFRILKSSISTYTNEKQVDNFPVLKIDGEYVIFYYNIVKQYQKELNK